MTPAGVWAQGVKVALLPAVSTVAPGATFDLSIDLTRAGSPFNAFDIYIGYDPAALTLLRQSPLSQQEGAYFISGCSNRFSIFYEGADRDTISESLLCAATSLTGPGQIYKLRFRASNTAQTTVVRFLPGLQFYNAGIFANPDSSSDATISIGGPLAVPVGSSAAGLRLLAAPNPARGAMSFELSGSKAGRIGVQVTDLQGRRVRSLEAELVRAGTASIRWDGTDESRIPVPPGVYVAWARVGDRTLHARFARIR